MRSSPSGGSTSSRTLADSGGVVVSYYEWLQNKRSERWDLADVLHHLERRMRRTYAQVRHAASQRGADWRTAAYGPLRAAPDLLLRARHLPIAATRTAPVAG